MIGRNLTTALTPAVCTRCRVLAIPATHRCGLSSLDEEREIVARELDQVHADDARHATRREMVRAAVERRRGGRAVH